MDKPPIGSGADSREFPGRGVVRWESPYGDEPEFAATLRGNPGRWAVIYEGGGAGFTKSHEYLWLTESDDPASDEFSLRWVQLDKNGEPVPPHRPTLRLDMQSRGVAYARYNTPEQTGDKQAPGDSA